MYHLGFKYPVEFSKKTYNPFKEFINGINEADINKKVYLNQYLDESVSTHDNLYRVLTYLEIYKGIEYGREKGLGIWVKLKQKVKLK